VNITDTIFEKRSNVFKPQRKFISALLTTIMLMRGSVNFRNMSRYSMLSEKTFSRQFRNPFDFARFNMIGTEMFVTPCTLMIATMDCSFIPKSGSHTYGLAKFYNGRCAKAEKGLEISLLAVTDVNYNTAYSVSRGKRLIRSPQNIHAQIGTLNILYRMLRVFLHRSAIWLLTDIMPKTNLQTA